MVRPSGFAAVGEWDEGSRGEPLARAVCGSQVGVGFHRTVSAAAGPTPSCRPPVGNRSPSLTSRAVSSEATEAGPNQGGDSLGVVDVEIELREQLLAHGLCRLAISPASICFSRSGLSGGCLTNALPPIPSSSP